MGGNIAEPASPYSYEVINWGRIFSLRIHRQQTTSRQRAITETNTRTQQHQHLLADMRRKVIQLCCHRIEKAQLFRLVLDLNFFKKEQRIDQIVLKESVRFAASRYHVGRIRSCRRIGADQLAIKRRHRFGNLRDEINTVL